jgi:hypothetical protein
MAPECCTEHFETCERHSSDFQEKKTNSICKVRKKQKREKERRMSL